MKNILRNLIILSAVLLFASCEKQPVGGNDPDNGTNQTLELMISLPEKIEGAAGDAISVKYYSGTRHRHAPKLFFLIHCKGTEKKRVLQEKSIIFIKIFTF